VPTAAPGAAPLGATSPDLTILSGVRPVPSRHGWTTVLPDPDDAGLRVSDPVLFAVSAFSPCCLYKVAVDRGAGDAEYLADVVGVDSFAFEFLGPGSVIDFAGPSAVAVVGRGCGASCSAFDHP
jgi:hypothetical protein